MHDTARAPAAVSSPVSPIAWAPIPSGPTSFQGFPSDRSRTVSAPAVTELPDLRADPRAARIATTDLRAVPREDAMRGLIPWSHMTRAERTAYRARYLERRAAVPVRR